MKTSRKTLTVLMLVAGLALLGGPMPVKAGGPTTFTFPGGSLTTTDLNAWGGMNTLVYDAYFDFSAGPTTITVHGMDLTDIWYEGEWPWPVAPESQGAQARFGVAADGFWSLHSIHSAIGYGGGSWDAQGADWDHDDGFRKYLIQNQWSGTTPGVTVGNHQYNVEAYIPRTGAGPSVNNPVQVVDRAYNTFDMKITYTSTGTPGEYQVLGWVRLHKAASTDEMAIRPGDPPWGSPYTWVWNKAINNQADPEDAWVPFYDGSWVITGDYTSARPYVQIMNWGVPQTSYHTFSWDSMVIEGTPAPAGEVCVDDDFAGSSPGDSLSGAACGMGTVIFGYNAFATIQDGIDAVSGSTVHVAAGTYNERLTINKSLDLRGAEYGVDPTAVGARTNPANESIVDVTGLGYANPDIAVEIASVASNVTIDGFTLIGDPTNPLADTSVIRCWANNVTIRNNIIDGKYDLLYKGGDTLTIDRNRIVVNKVGVTVQPGLASNVTVSDNVFTLGPSPATDAAAIYMTSCSQCSVTGNTATGFINSNGLGGSNLGHLTVSGNTFTGNKKGVNIWGSSTYITISDNDLSNSSQCGIEIKGQDIDITGNEISNNGDVGINIDRHVINTERVTILCNNISGNMNYGVQVNTANVNEIISAEYNWWDDASGPFHPTSNPGGNGDAVSDGVDFDPWLSAPVGDTCPPPADDEGPITSNVVATPNPAPVNTAIVLTANVDDSTTGGSNIASAEYNINSGSFVAMNAQDGGFDEVSEDVEATVPTFAEAGIHEVCIRGTDAAGNTGSAECILLAAYDPEGGFVTGGGWIWSPKGAYYPDDTLEGKATFGFVSKYKKGTQTPEGQTEFVFQVASLNFHSSSYDWLVVAGAKAMFKGTGTINGEGLYKFMLTALDADINENDALNVDRFRIKIWSEDTGGNETVIYDNGLGADDNDDNATTEIGGGATVIHTKK